MDNAETRKWLEEVWSRVLQQEDVETNSQVDRLVNSKVLSIRYAVLTQILGKIANSDRSLLSLQLGTPNSPSAWDARSFCSAVIVPWVADNHDVLGKSPDPYVSNPLRRPRLDQGTDQLRDKAEWEALVAFLLPLDSVDQNKLEATFVSCLVSTAKRLADQSFKYQIPARISLSQMLELIRSFVSETSGGLRPLAVTAAMMAVLGRAFSIFTSISSQGLNEADSASGALGDIMCLDSSGNIILAIEVKDRALTLADVRSATMKAETPVDSLRNLLFVSQGIRSDERDIIFENIKIAWAAGLNISQIDILDLANSAFSLLKEEWRPTLLKAIGDELDRRGDHAHRRKWHKLLSNLNSQQKLGQG